MAKFAYNNMMNASTSHISFELHRDFHCHISYKENINP